MKAVIILGGDEDSGVNEFHHAFRFLVPPLTFDFTYALDTDVSNNDNKFIETLAMIDKVSHNPRGFVAILRHNNHERNAMLKSAIANAGHKVTGILVRKNDQPTIPACYDGVIDNIYSEEHFIESVRKCASNTYHLTNYYKQ